MSGKFRKRPVVVFVILVSVIFIACISFFTVNAMFSKNKRLLKDEYNFLILGIDTVGSNTDVMAIANYKSNENKITVLQIPRDTYIEVDRMPKKINQLYAYYLSSNRSHDEAINKICDDIESCMGISIDNYASATLEGFSSFIDSIDGITIDIPCDMVYNDPEQGLYISLKAGSNHLNGDGCAQFVRFRDSYIEGDLGRVDAQKIFIAALYEKIAGYDDFDMTTKAVMSFASNFQTNISISDAILIAKDMKDKIKDASLTMATLPGEATRWNVDNGTWYYVVNKKAANDLLTNELKLSHLANDEFDPENMLTNDEKIHIDNIYNSKAIKYKIYHKEDINKIKIYTNAS